MAAKRSYVAVTLTLSQNSTQNILSLIDAALGSGICPGACRELNLQSASGNTASIFVGDSNLGAANCGYELPAGASSPGASRTYRSGAGNMVDLASLYVLTAGVSQKLNVEVVSY
jgi:hypothetical protein